MQDNISRGVTFVADHLSEGIQNEKELIQL